jgi:hypothetical protein
MKCISHFLYARDAALLARRGEAGNAGPGAFPARAVPEEPATGFARGADASRRLHQSVIARG